MKIHCEVVYATPERQSLIKVEVDNGCTLAEAIQQSGLLEKFPEIDLSKQPIGVYSQRRDLASKVTDGDRIEIYRHLTIDPMEARRKKAKKRAV